MIEAMSLRQLGELTNGVMIGRDLSFSDVSTDTRAIAEGDLFIALRGPNFNGNSFVADAERARAAAALVSEPVNAGIPTIQVVDTRIALGLLANANRRNSRAIVLGLTGSQGKTSVKEMTAAILSKAGNVHATRGNLNNDIGVPLTLLQLKASHDFAVIEMGANAGGEIAYTTALTEPCIAHITNIAGTHLEGFGSLEGVANAKAELWLGLREDGKAIVNLDDPLIPGRVHVSNRQQFIGISAEGKSSAGYRIEDYQEQGLLGSVFTLVHPLGKQLIKLPLPGRHNAANALAAAAMAMEAGADGLAVAAGLAEMQSVKGRLVIRKGKQGSVILDDSYNASPASFRAAVEVLKQQSGIRIVVAGDMAELGAEQYSAHIGLGEYIRDQGIELLFGSGELTRLAIKAFGSKGIFTTSNEELAALILPCLNADVTVLVKGSRSAGMERVVKQLILQED